MSHLRRGAAVLLLLCCSLSLTVPFSAAQRSQVRARDEYSGKLYFFEQFVKNQMEQDRIPGLTIGFKKGNQTWVKGFGYADLEKRAPATAESAYRLASVTKTMTGTAIVQLVERGKIKLDDEIQTYVPYYPKQKWPVTVRQLLVHLGGGQTGSGFGPEHVTPREVVARIAKYPIKNEPGVKFDYQTSGYNLLGAAIEEVTGQTLDEYFRANLWTPTGMKDTRMDDPKLTIPNRVERYELVDGQIKKAPFADVSSRFGGGGAIGTVPDLLRWGHNVERSGVVSRSSFDLMMTPVADKRGRWVGIDDGTWYYTLGWQVLPVDGQYTYHNDGGQAGTNTAVLHIPPQDLTIAFACNLMTIDRGPYIKALYQAVTDRPWDIPVFTKDKVDEAVYRGMSSTFDYGSMHFDRTEQAMPVDASDLAKSFAYFNKTVNRESLKLNFAATATAINDGRHPLADSAFIKVGSEMARALTKKYGAARFDSYHTTGAIPFFADYIRLYKGNSRTPASLRFEPAFEKLTEKWDQDWAKTWNDYTRRFDFTAGSDVKNIEQNLRPIFVGAEVYPNLIPQLLNLRQSFAAKKDWNAAAEVARVTAELYAASDRANVFYAISLTIIGKTDEARGVLRKAVSIDSKGIASAGAFNQIGLAIAGADQLPAAIEWLKLAVELYPDDAALYASMGDLYKKQGGSKQSIEYYKKALSIDPKLERAKEELKKLTAQ